MSQPVLGAGKKESKNTSFVQLALQSGDPLVHIHTHPIPHKEPLFQFRLIVATIKQNPAKFKSYILTTPTKREELIDQKSIFAVKHLNKVYSHWGTAKINQAT